MAEIEPFHIPPRPEGGYPDEFFESWDQSNARTWARWMRAYHETNPGDPHNDLGRWLDKVAPSSEPMRVITVRLPEHMVARAEAEGSKRGDRDGRSGVIRDSLNEHWARIDQAS